MHGTSSHRLGYVLAALAGALGGGLVVALATKAFPRMVAGMASSTMQTMMSRMGQEGCDPAEM